VALAAFATVGGLAWLSQRSHAVSDAVAAFRSDDGTVLVSREPHVLREGGAYYDPDERWLTATTPRDLARAGAIASAVDAPALRYVAAHGRRIPANIGDWQRVGRTQVEFVPGFFVDVVTYTRTGAG
jgi:hypothetical protein